LQHQEKTVPDKYILNNQNALKGENLWEDRQWVRSFQAVKKHLENKRKTFALERRLDFSHQKCGR
jgi:hypothetical protein